MAARIEVYQLFGRWRGVFVSEDQQRAEDCPLHVRSIEGARAAMALRHDVPVESVRLREYPTTNPITQMRQEA